MYSCSLVFLSLAASALSAALNGRPEVLSDGNPQEATSCAQILPLVGYSAGRKFCLSRQEYSTLTSTINPFANRTATPPYKGQGWPVTTITSRAANSLPSTLWGSLEGAEPDQIDRICSCVAQASVVVGFNSGRNWSEGQVTKIMSGRPSRLTHHDSNPS